jgi:hypothetical protein
MPGEFRSALANGGTVIEVRRVTWALAWDSVKTLGFHELDGAETVAHFEEKVTEQFSLGEQPERILLKGSQEIYPERVLNPNDILSKKIAELDKSRNGAIDRPVLIFQMNTRASAYHF